MNNKPIYKIVDDSGRILLPKYLREQIQITYGDIVALGISDGKITIRKVDLIEVGDQSQEALEAYVRAAFKSMPDAVRLDMIAELSNLLQKKEH